MTADDIYNAAVTGDREQLLELLAQEEAKALLNEVSAVEVEDAEGMVIEFALAFSILYDTRGAVPYDMLDILADAGMSFEKTVVLKQNGETKSRPLLEYAISVWEDPQLVEYLLKKGVSPDTVHKATGVHGKTSTTTMLWYALNCGKAMQMLELLLKYGADPDKCCQIYDEEEWVYQYLPPLYYALVKNRDLEQTVCLIRYGASVQCGIDIGTGFMHKTNFRRYVSLYQSDLSNTLDSAFAIAQADPPPEKFVQAKTGEAVSNRTMMAQAPNDAPGRKCNGGSNVISSQRCYSKGTAYAFANFGFMGLGFGILGPMLLAKRQPDTVTGLLMFGLPCLLIAASIWMSVRKKAKKRGLEGVMPRFLADSILLFGKILLCMSIILIPLVIAIANGSPWETRQTADGRTVRVRKTGDGCYVDPDGRQYYEKD